MGKKRRSKGKRTDSGSEDGGGTAKSVVFLSSSDDEEANGDLSLEIVEKARRRSEGKRKRAEDVAAVIDLSSASSEEAEALTAAAESPNAVADGEVGEEKKKKRRKPRGKKKKGKEEADVDATLKEEEPVGTGDSVVTEVNETPDNAVLRKLLRGPRYFDPGDINLGTCFNCGEEGHVAARCTMEKRQKPCFVCGMFGHNAKHCTLGQDCFICKRRGHIAKNCPDKHKRTTPQDSIICLRCGELGHEMLSCANDYAPDDLKEIQCYICKNYGHLCCVDFNDDNNTGEISCYNCAQPGHTGLGCAKLRGEVNDVVSPTLCYKCGEEGHFARGCKKNRKFDRWEGGFSTPRRSVKENGDSAGFRSDPHDNCRTHKKKKSFEYDRWNTTTGKSKVKGGWIVDDPGDLPKRKHKANGWNDWKSSSAPIRKSHKYLSASDEQYSGSQSPFKRHGSSTGIFSSNGSASSHRHGYSASRFGKSQGLFH